MVDSPKHLEAVPEGGPSFQEMAVETDAAVFNMMAELRANHPGLGGAIVAGTAGGLARYQLQGMPDGTSAQQVLEVLAPIIRNVAGQIVEEQRKRQGRPVPKVPVLPPQKTAFDRLQAALSTAPFPTYCIWNEGRLVLISTIVASNGVLTHGSIPNLEGATTRPEEVIRAHCLASAARWKADTELPERAKEKAAEHRARVEEVQGWRSGEQKAALEISSNQSAAEALEWVVGLIENPEGETHVGNA